MKRLIFLKGLPGSGKSTWAREFMKTHPEFKRVNKDDLRAMLDDSKHSKGRENFVIQTETQMIQSLLLSGYSVIVDNTHFNPKHKERILGLLEGMKSTFGTQVQFEEKVFDVLVEECIARDAKRPNPVGKKVIMQMYNDYIRGAIQPYPHVQGRSNVIICDIDGTLALMKNRKPFEWLKVGQDIVNEPVKLILESLRNIPIILLSGRDAVCREETQEWLRSNNIKYDYLYMRLQNDNRPDTVVKKELFDQYIKDQYNVLLVIDDRPCMTKLWKEMGLFVFDVYQDPERIDF